MTIRNHVIIGLSMLALTACSTSDKVSSKYVGSVADGKNGVIIASYGGETRCDNFVLGFKNIVTGEVFTTSKIDADWMKSVESSYNKVGYTAVRPGEYKLAHATCLSFGRFVNFKKVSDWFDPFVVNAGEAVYPGTLIPETVKATDERGRNIRHVVYRRADKSKLVRSAVADRTPDLTNQFVTRLAPARLDIDTVKTLIGKVSVPATETGDAARRKAALEAKSALARYLVTGKIPANP